MKDKILKAYRTAWRWPQVYTSDPVVIWISRIIVFVLPLGLILLTLLTGVPQYGWFFTLLFAFLVVLGLLGITINMFYPEYDTVKSFQTREARIKQFFHGFPQHTDIPLIEYEPHEWISYGHINPKEFVEAIGTVIYKGTEDAALADAYLRLESSVGHGYATFRNPAEGHWDEGLKFCKPSDEDCFPVTSVVKKED